RSNATQGLVGRPRSSCLTSKGVRTPNRTLNIPGFAKKISIHKGVWISRNDEPIEVVIATLTIRSETELTIYFSGTILRLRCSLYECGMSSHLRNLPHAYFPSCRLSASKASAEHQSRTAPANRPVNAAHHRVVRTLLGRH